MRKIFKIIAVVFGVLIIAAIASFSLIMFDVAGSLASGSKPLPNGAAIGKALIVYDPGLTGGARDIAEKIGYNLQSSGYDVMLAGVKSSQATDISNYKVIVVGGPIYAGKPASSIQSYLNTLTPTQQTKVGAFGYGMVKVDNTNSTAVKADVAQLPANSQLTLNAVVKITSDEDSNALCANFVSTLLK